jgi:hypothetical protein
MRRRLGELLVGLGVTSAEGVARALAAQEVSHERLGSALVRLGLASPERIDAAVEVQQGAVSPLARRRLGEWLVDLGVVTGSVLERALSVPRRRGEKIGQALVRLGVATEAGIASALRAQRLAASSLGSLMVRTGALGEEQLAYALAFSRRTGRRLGDALVELGQTTGDSVQNALRLQNMVRAGISIATLAVAINVATASGADAATGGQLDVQSSASSSVNMVIPERLTLGIETVTDISDGMELAVIGGQFHQWLTGSSYLDGGTTAVSPNQLMSFSDYGALKIKLMPDENGQMPDVGEVFAGVMTVTISPT